MYTHEYKSVCVGTEFQDSLYTVMVNVEINPSQPNHFSIQCWPAAPLTRHGKICSGTQYVPR